MRNFRKAILALTLSTFCMVLMAQNITVSGVITDEIGQQMIGATVLEQGTTNQSLSDANGKYVIKTKMGATLVFSYIGYNSVSIKVNKTQHNVQLTPTDAALDEVVVVGFGSRNKLMVTGAVAAQTHGANAIYRRPTPHPTMPIIFAENVNSEEYGTYRENRFVSVQQEALSTLSLDVDAASYSNIRRMINAGKMPEKDAVRIEEMINYFSYNYAEPKGEHPVNINAQITESPWNKDYKIARIAVKAQSIPTENMPSSNFVFLIDVSGSMMGPTRLDLVKSSLKMLTNNLRATDRVAIVVYAGAAGIVLPSTEGKNKQKIIDALDGLTAGGSTAGGAGIQLAYKIAERNFIKGGNNRIILCTDGDFNVGVSSNEGLENLIAEKRKTGIFLTVLGYGMGNYKDKQLQTLAEKGNGNHAYIDNIQEANRVLVQTFGSTLFTVAKDVKLQIEFNPQHVSAYRLIGYESRLLNKEDFNDDTKDAAELGAGHTVTALYEIVPVGVQNKYGGVDPLKYQKTSKKTVENAISDEWLTVKLRYKAPDSDKSKKLEIALKKSDLNKSIDKDFNFAMSVAMFGQMLRKSDFVGTSSYDKVLALARDGIDNDDYGYKMEFVRLVSAIKEMEK